MKQSKGDAALLLHTGDVSQLSRAAQFDTAEQIIRGAGLETHHVPGEHDVLDEDGNEPELSQFVALWRAMPTDGPEQKGGRSRQ